MVVVSIKAPINRFGEQDVPKLCRILVYKHKGSFCCGVTAGDYFD